MSGWLIRVSDWDNNGPVRLFAAGDGDPRAALVTVQKLTGAAPKLRVETVGELGAETLRLLGLAPGQARDLNT